ncbi:uncharacterized protein BP5553_09752 [Venustampulla echinocandica]|uniref:tetrahydrofolate synthase n=1 Tax=Venustampulla echinocandica TaxID=2656787 RepID=A0A370TBX5_9HELO|nr:uncharacterized protein BP5553_09752 [Venustampulla echinocandica]RDL31543.1 hypothetical protein BP5553_09752 [Venustampulla echinocandica]
MERSYDEAIRCLNSRKASPKPNLDDMRGSDDMVEWLELLGHSAEHMDSLNAIHVSGTNGKGSTCAFVASFLKAHGNNTGYPQSIGLYTSPHMKSIRERIRINGEPISEEHFTTRFFEIWDKLPGQATPTLDIPRYLQLLALLSFHVFIEEKVDVAIYECHLGAEFDATNIIRTPLATAITPISMDHASLLGPTIQDIAWHKAGILKSECLAFSAIQNPEVAMVLEQRAAEKGVVLKYIGVDSALPTYAAALKPEFQRINCSLALAVVRAWLSVKAPQGQSSMENTITRGIEQFSWPGRYQQINQRNCQWFLDGAHNDLSLRYAVKWFAETATGKQNNSVISTRILIFSQFSTRDGTALLRSIAESLQDNKIWMQYIIFTTYDERRDGQTRIDRNLKKRFSAEVQARYAETWGHLDPTATVLRERTIEGALDRAREIGDQNNGMQAPALLPILSHLSLRRDPNHDLPETPNTRRALRKGDWRLRHEDRFDEGGLMTAGTITRRNDPLHSPIPVLAKETPLAHTTSKHELCHELPGYDSTLEGEKRSQMMNVLSRSTTSSSWLGFILKQIYDYSGNLIDRTVYANLHPGYCIHFRAVHSTAASEGVFIRGPEGDPHHQVVLIHVSTVHYIIMTVDHAPLDEFNHRGVAVVADGVIEAEQAVPPESRSCMPF